MAVEEARRTRPQRERPEVGGPGRALGPQRVRVARARERQPDIDLVRVVEIVRVDVLGRRGGDPADGGGSGDAFEFLLQDGCPMPGATLEKSLRERMPPGDSRERAPEATSPPLDARRHASSHRPTDDPGSSPHCRPTTWWTRWTPVPGRWQRKFGSTCERRACEARAARSPGGGSTPTDQPRSADFPCSYGSSVRNMTRLTRPQNRSYRFEFVSRFRVCMARGSPRLDVYSKPRQARSGRTDSVAG